MDKDVIKVKHTSIIVPNYELGDVDKIERMLSIWNPTYFRHEDIGFHYDEDKKLLYLPRGLDLNYIERTFHKPLEVQYEPDPSERASYRLKVEPRNNIQRKSISYLLGEGDFHYTKKQSQLSLNLDTGDGKTYCVIAALTFMKTKGMIITHVDNIKNQWRDSILKMTDIDEKFIFNISGSSVIRKIMKMDKLPYKIYLINHRTIQSYAKSEGWDAVGELFKKLQIGVKVFDEAHLEFSNLMKTDLHTNTKKTIYLTANFERSSVDENKVFSLCFKNIPKYGVETRKEKRKHIIYVPVTFNSKPSLETRASMKGLHGFSRNKYIDYQIENEKFFEVVLWIVEHFKKQKGKMLLLFSKIDATQAIYDYLKEVVPDKTIGIYNSTISDDDKEKAVNSDIIISTPKSMGTGTDIPGLTLVLMTEPYTSNITANQTSGRLREYGEDAYTFYLELMDTGFPDVMKMYRKRLPLFKKKCVKILELAYPN